MALDFDGGLTLAMQSSDLDRTIGWYQRVLGFTLLYKVDEAAWCELATPVAKVNIGFSQVEAVGTGGGATPTFGVTDILAAQAHVKTLGIRTDGDIQHIPGLVKLLTIYDPDDQPIMLYQTDEGAG